MSAIPAVLILVLLFSPVAFALQTKTPIVAPQHQLSSLTGGGTNACMPTANTRRQLLGSLSLPFLVVFYPFPGRVAVEEGKDDDDAGDVRALRAGSEALKSLLDNWDRATTDCNYADVPRDLLSVENKEELLEKAKVSALFDKSASVTSCRRTTGTVMDYLGDTGIGPLANIDRRLVGERSVARLIDGDAIEDYFQEVETFLDALSRSSSMAYMARKDFDAINTFLPGEEQDDGRSALDQTRKAVAETKMSLDRIIGLIGR